MEPTEFAGAGQTPTQNANGDDEMSPPWTAAELADIERRRGSLAEAHADRRLRRLVLTPTPEDIERDAKQRLKKCEFEEGQRRFRIDDFMHRLAADLGRRYTPKCCSLDAYEIYDEDQRETLAKVRALVDDLPALVEAGRGILFVGTPGTGKDYLLASLLYAAAGHDRRCRWVNGRAFFQEARERMFSGGRRERGHVFADFLLPAVLAMSDPFPPIGKSSTWCLEQLAWLIDERYRAKKCTWATFNALTIAEAKAKFSSAVWDRLSENAEVLPCFWPSYRQRVGKAVGDGPPANGKAPPRGSVPG